MILRCCVTKLGQVLLFRLGEDKRPGTARLTYDDEACKNEDGDCRYDPRLAYKLLKAKRVISGV